MHKSTAAAMGEAIVQSRTVRQRILVVDDELDTCEVMCLLLEGEGYEAVPETSPQDALRTLAAGSFDLVLTDVGMAEMNGLEFCRRITEIQPGMPVILVTGQGTMDTVIAALRIGARDFLTKPIESKSLFASIARTLRAPARAQATSSAEPTEEGGEDEGVSLVFDGVRGRSTAMRSVYKLIADLSESTASVLIHGETGTGKELVARAIHDNSRARKGPFVALNCAAMPAGLLESELFGHARGAFTDAKTASVGLLVQANGGTLLLDEIGELPLTMQPKLLRALQERMVRPVGETREVPFDCRVIAATNRDLEAEVLAKRFREDLFYRINVVRILVPPLRNRGEDVLLMARHFLRRFGATARRNPMLSVAVAEKFLTYGWPGNVRELENCIERAVALSRADQVDIADLPDKIRLSDDRRDLPSSFEPEASTHTHEREGAPNNDSAANVVSLLEVERHHILRAIRLLGGNKTMAAELLGIDRRTLYRRLQQYGVAAPE